MLDACAVPNLIATIFGEKHIYVPALYEKIATVELGLYIEETFSSKPKPELPIHKNAGLAVWFMFLLLVWGMFQNGIFSLPEGFASGKSFIELGSLDSQAFKFKKEYFRAATALTIHASATHLAGNIFFGSIFLYFLARVTGPGAAVFLTIVCGIIGNCLSVFMHKGAYVSIGFSTALFAVPGLLGGIMAICDRQKMLLPIAAAAGILAMLGTEGEQTDYVAHICGLGTGIIAGMIVGLKFRSGKKFQLQSFAWISGIVILLIAWAIAFGYLN